MTLSFAQNFRLMIFSQEYVKSLKYIIFTSDNTAEPDEGIFHTKKKKTGRCHVVPENCYVIRYSFSPLV